MKHFISTIMALACVLVMSTSAFAFDACESVPVLSSVTYTNELDNRENVSSLPDTDDGSEAIARSRTVKDLGKSSSIKLSWTVESEKK